MKNNKGFTKGFFAGLVLALGLTLSSVAFTQNTTPTDPKKDAASCCAMASCCGDSCSRKDHAKHDKSKEHSLEHSTMAGGCCCCKADSCSMEMKDKKGN